MDKTAIVKMIAGTITRGVMWAIAYVSGKLGIESVDQSTGEAVGWFAASAIVAGAALAWSWYKNRKLLNQTPPSPGK